MPVIERSHIRLHRDTYFMLVQQQFYNHIFRRAFLAEEHQLYISCHRRNLVVAPRLIELIGVGLLVIAVLQLHQSCQGDNVSIMCKAESSRVSTRSNSLVGSGNDVLQCRFGVCHHQSVGHGRGTVAHVVLVVVYLPNVE